MTKCMGGFGQPWHEPSETLGGLCLECGLLWADAPPTLSADNKAELIDVSEFLRECE